MRLTRLQWAAPDRASAQRAYKAFARFPFVTYVRVRPVPERIWMAPGFLGLDKGLEASHTDIVQVGLPKQAKHHFLEAVKPLGIEVTNDPERWALVFQQPSSIEVHVVQLQDSTGLPDSKG